MMTVTLFHVFLHKNIFMDESYLYQRALLWTTQRMYSDDCCLVRRCSKRVGV